jgi:translation elongation factor EF-Tu-like GTPase
VSGSVTRFTSVALRYGQTMSRPEFGLSLDVRVDLWPSEAGGRSTPIESGYRPICVIKGADAGERSFGLCELVLADPLAPGNSADGHLLFDIAFSNDVRALVHIGSRFDIAEGTRRVGSVLVRGIDP